MRSRLLIALLAGLWLAACKSGGDAGDESTEPAEGQEAAGDESTEAAPTPNPGEGQEGSENTQAQNQPGEPATGGGEGSAQPFEGVRNGRFESERFNIRFTLPGDWQLASTQSDDSLTFTGPGDLQMVVANSESIQLVDGNFSQLNDRVSFDAVNVLPDRTQSGPVNGMAGYRVEGDALLRGENQPIYFVSQAVNVPGEPVMVTIFIPGDNYFEHSDAMHAVLDSIEALDLRPTE